LAGQLLVDDYPDVQTVAGAYAGESLGTAAFNNAIAALLADWAPAGRMIRLQPDASDTGWARLGFRLSRRFGPT
jgi:hypothetical protein